ncbi:hypothetical protein QR77_29220, partial [Streptomyces sp. 150FB]
MAGAFDLRAPDTSKTVWRQAVHNPVIQHTRRMHHTTQRTVTQTHTFDERRHRSTITHITRHRRDPIAELQHHALVQDPATTGQYDVLRTTRHQPPSDLHAESARSTGDQHRPPRNPPATIRPGTHETTAIHLPVTHRHLILATQTGNHTRSQTLAHHVDQTAPAIPMLQRHRPAQTPHTRLHHTNHITRHHRHTTAGHHPQRPVDTTITQPL